MSVSPIHTRIWQEEPEADNPFATRVARCHGYDVYGAMLGRAGWADMVYLLFRGEAPQPWQARMMDLLAVAMANAGPRDPAVHAAMGGGIGGSTAASSLMAALAVGAGQSGGAREVFLAVQDWHDCGCDLAAWRARIAARPDLGEDIWPTPEHAAGFDVNGVSTPLIVQQALDALTRESQGTRLAWLQSNRVLLEESARSPLAMTGVAAAALADLGFEPAQAEMLFLLLRLPGAAAHAVEQGGNSYKRFPFYPVELEDDPAKRGPSLESLP
ncbi:MAG TPA: citryl-CoA lyase [Candidatus Aquabacterium excrementipullorum]|nr:citryl-CoA lyase [Candidatus Aquabacterium excrementipullorum]